MFFVFQVSGIMCYQCNSVNNSDCTSLPVYKSKNIRTIEPTECMGDFMGQEPFCKKTVLDGKTNQIKCTNFDYCVLKKVDFSIGQWRQLAPANSEKLRIFEK